jgi:hypothetical protein
MLVISKNMGGKLDICRCLKSKHAGIVCLALLIASIAVLDLRFSGESKYIYSNYILLSREYSILVDSSAIYKVMKEGCSGKMEGR